MVVLGWFLVWVEFGVGVGVEYCESILFRGAEISSFEDDGHIRGYLTSWIALPTKLKKYKIITFKFNF